MKRIFKLVDCDPSYWQFVRKLRTDSRVTQSFIQQKSITPQMQVEYMKKYSNNYKIGVVDESPAGFIGVIENDLRICVDPDYQKIGLGKFMVKEMIKIWPNLYAKVKITNLNSLRLFESCGFFPEFLILSPPKNASST